MPERLSEILNELHQQLEAAEPLDPEVEQQLRQVMQEIGEALPQEDAAEQLSPLRQRIRDASDHFEQSHPVLYRTIDQLVDGLGQIGI